MTRLAGISPADLRGELESFEKYRSMRRLFAALLYTQGVSAPTIAEWLDVRPATVYAWFDRLEQGKTIRAGVFDDERSGRPPKLSGDDRQEMFELLRRRPAVAGYDSGEWSSTTAQTAILDRFGVEYSARHVRRLIREAEQRSEAPDRSDRDDRIEE